MALMPVKVVKKLLKVCEEYVKFPPNSDFPNRICSLIEYAISAKPVNNIKKKGI
jgi:hypothetical protein